MTETLLFDCHSKEHQIVIQQIGENVYATIHLQPKSFLSRLTLGIRYIFGYRSQLGNFDEFKFTPDKADKLQKLVNVLKAKKEVESADNSAGFRLADKYLRCSLEDFKKELILVR
jgi:hypothetical protein